MACVKCARGIWVCEEGNSNPKCGQTELMRAWDYQGRYRVPKGLVTVWCREGSDVAVSQAPPLSLPNPQPAWKSAGRICVPANADYDIWRKPGGGCELMIAQAANTSVDQDCEEDGDGDPEDGSASAY